MKLSELLRKIEAGEVEFNEKNPLFEQLRVKDLPAYISALERGYNRLASRKSERKKRLPARVVLHDEELSTMIFPGEPATYYCPNCNTEIRKGMRFCFNCAQEIKWNSKAG